LQIVLTAGNHDAGSRLEAPAELMGSLNITVVGTVARDAAGAIEYQRLLVPLKDANGDVSAIAIAVPFLRPADVPEIPGSSDSYLDGIQEFYRCAIEAAQILRASAHPKAALVALGHCHMQHAVESRDSERRIVIGGAEALRADTFPADLAYVALGHLHKPQEFDGGRIRYCGSPIPLSFSEKEYAHRVIEVVFDGEGNTTAASVPVPKTAVLQRLPADAAAPIGEVLQLLASAQFDPALPPEAHPFLEVRVLDDGPDPTRRRRIESVLEGKAVRLASIKLESPPKTEAAAEVAAAASLSLADLGSLDPEEIALSAHRERYNSELEAGVLAALREILVSEAHSPTATVE
jgi:exonuclease SbcD